MCTQKVDGVIMSCTTFFPGNCAVRVSYTEHPPNSGAMAHLRAKFIPAGHVESRVVCLSLIFFAFMFCLDGKLGIFTFIERMMVYFII